MAIAIIADDLSGATELAGIAFAHGCTAEVQRQFEPASQAEVIAVDTDSRGLPPDVAADRVRAAASAILAAKPAWIFKKVDSLLRGNARVEVEALRSVTGHQKTILVPANPSRGRTIVSGRYLIEGVPLDQTALAGDPQHPRASALVPELLGGASLRGDLLVPDVSSVDELRGIARRIDDDTLAAGAADLFACLLDHRRPPRGPASMPLRADVELPALFVCGSLASWDRHASRCAAVGVPVQRFPREYADERWSIDVLPHWAGRGTSLLTEHGRLLVGIGPLADARAPGQLTAILASVTALILQQVPVATLLVDGGATAAAVALRLNWQRLAVAASAPAGIGILQPIAASPAPRTWIKPGSYPWPEAVWKGLQ